MTSFQPEMPTNCFQILLFLPVFLSACRFFCQECCGNRSVVVSAFFVGRRLTNISESLMNGTGACKNEVPSDPVTQHLLCTFYCYRLTDQTRTKFLWLGADIQKA